MTVVRKPWPKDADGEPIYTCPECRKAYKEFNRLNKCRWKHQVEAERNHKPLPCPLPPMKK